MRAGILAMERRLRIALGVVPLAETMRTLSAQHTGTVVGTVKGPSGAVLPGAEVSAKNVETGIVRKVETGERGEYRLAALPVGTYDIETSVNGFQTGVRKGIVLSLGRDAVVDFSLQVGAV